MPRMTKYEFGTICWVDLGTTKPAAAKSFYRDLFGWTMQDIEGVAPAAYTMANSPLGPVSGIYEQTEEHRHHGAQPIWLAYLRVADADVTVRRARSLGARLVVPPFDVLDKGRASLLQDPTGAAFALWQPLSLEGSAAVHEPGSYTWAELFTHDVDRAGRFYAQLFGWQARPEHSPGGPVTRFLIDGVPIASLRSSSGITFIPAGYAPLWVVYFAVHDRDAALQRARELGATAVGTAAEGSGLGRVAVAKDPQDALFGLMEPRAADVAAP